MFGDVLDTENNKVLSWMRRAGSTAQVVVCVNFTPEPQKVDLATGATGVGPRRVKTLLKTPGAADPVSLGAIELGPFGVYIGEVQ